MLDTSLAGVRRTLRRLVLRRRRFLSALLLGVAVWAAVQAMVPPPPPTVAVVVAARDLPAGSVLTAADLASVDLPPGAAPVGTVKSSYALGRTTTGPVRSGEPITDVRLVGDSMLAGHRGLVAVPLRLPDAGVVGLLRVGDRIDLLATDQRSGDTHTVAEHLIVLALPQEEGVSQQNGTPGRLVVIGATSRMSTKLVSTSVTMYLSAVIAR